MIKTFILILWIKSGYAGGLTTTEFNSREACDTAGRAAVQAFEGVVTGVSFTCVEKG